VTYGGDDDIDDVIGVLNNKGRKGSDDDLN
jgi:hypothetical protein